MITNIVDRRTNTYNILCDAVFEPCWHDNNVTGSTTVFPLDDTFTYDELPRTAIAAAIRYANDKWPDVPTTVYLYDWESLDESDVIKSEVYPDQYDLFDQIDEDEPAGC